MKLANELAGTRRRTGKHVAQAVAQLFGTPAAENEDTENPDVDEVVVETVPVVIEKPVVTPDQLFDLIEEIRIQIDEIGTMQALVNQLGTLRSMLTTFIEQRYANANQNN